MKFGMETVHAQRAAVARWYCAVRARTVERLIFTATTGRSGTLTLSKAFAGIPGCCSLHEPSPVMNNEVLRAASFGNDPQLERFYRTKLNHIMRAAAGHRYYLEANHLFIKTFIGHAAREFGNRMAVIHLVRPAIDVAMSIYRLQVLPGIGAGNRWWLDYRAPLNRIRIADALDGDEFSHSFYKGLWYWFEIEARVEEWRRRLPGVPFVRFETGWLNDPERLVALASALGVAVDRRLIESQIGVRENEKTQEKLIAPLPPEEAVRMFEHFLALLRQRYPAIVATGLEPHSGGVRGAATRPAPGPSPIGEAAYVPAPATAAVLGPADGSSLGSRHH
ncbi:MAG TPA: hypothetical protein VKB72_13455 [Steroidobacteraceae bacterium]|nr:hypothetical protein [Steroidobacteraceae bacterium]